ncbi:protein RMD5 A [Cinnamomum micranthum f. kanehirae]|uniref:Protein RMD5 A n=1 Tax=Cinnamomum micranthum f. kanehirae TaxID=337451 RepID=A0A3S3MVS1_9MAGN|nr:protein RMD5 A [Cinnamomum micranthum f. kanehirae]
MDLSTIKDAFDQVSKKQQLSCYKAQEVIDQVVRETECALAKLQLTEDTDFAVDLKTLLTELKNKLNEIGPINQLEQLRKELNVGLNKYTKLLEKSFIPDISKAYRDVDFDIHIVNQIVATHLYREGFFDLGDCFVNEVHESEATTLKSPLLEMHRILEAMRCRNLEPALMWAAANHDKLLQIGSSLELKLHQLQFVEILQKGSRDDALKYIQTHLAPFASNHMLEIQKLMACLLWLGRLNYSPYAEILSPVQWEKVAEELTRQFWKLLGQSHESPLITAMAAGVQGLPTLLKLANVMAAKQQEWLAMKQLPVPVELGSEFQFHSIFVCPVSRDQATEENPPMLMPCGHVLCKQSIVKLSKSSTRTFKCPYCPLVATVAECRSLHF